MSGPISHGRLSVISGTGVTFWGGPDTTPEIGGRHAAATQALELRLTADRPAVVGRAEGGEIEYLDPSYRPTTVMPGSGQTILQSGGGGRDIYVSRGHFMLRAVAGGIVFVNGVPRRGGGIRPPVNGTELVEPQPRDLLEGEEYQIAAGSAIVVRLPNGAEVRIEASDPG